MSKLFYDHLIVIEEVEAEIKNIAESPEEREELWQIVDEIIHMRMLELFLNKLSEEHHDEFLEKFHKRPHDESLLGYLKEKINEDVEEFVKKEIKLLEKEILRDIKKGSSK
jgi:hypothetical protein